MSVAQADKVIVYLRTSERVKYRRCRQAWQWSYVDGMAPNSVPSKLSFGTLIHSALAGWYVPGVKRGTHPAEVFEEEYRKNGHVFGSWDEEGNKTPALELGLAMCNGYVKQFGKDSHLQIIQPEMAFAIDIYDRKGNYLCTYVARLDGVFRNRQTKRLGILEHKTCKSLPGMVPINSFYGEQGLTYWWAATMYLRHLGILKKDEVLEEILFNFLRKGLPDERIRNAAGHALNKDGTVSKRQPAGLFQRDSLMVGHNELANIARRIRSEAWEIGQARKGKLPIYKNPTMDCVWDCAFKDACEIHEMGGDWQTVFDMEFHPYNPYEEYELEFNDA